MTAWDLSGRVALVTGASSGIGLATAQTLNRAGAVVFAGGRDGRRLECLAERHGFRTAPFDVTDRAALRAAIEVVESQGGPIDLLVAGVGQRQRRLVEDIDRDGFARLIEINLTSTYDLVREVGTRMAERGSGTVVIISSIAAHRATPGNSSYAASKAALDALVRGLAVEWGPRGVRVNAVSPGPILTEANAAIAADPERSQQIVARQPLRRWGEPDEVAESVAFLSSSSGSFVTGHVLVVDGGASVLL